MKCTSGTKSIVNLTLETKGPVYGCVGSYGWPEDALFGTAAGPFAYSCAYSQSHYYSYMIRATHETPGKNNLN